MKNETYVKVWCTMGPISIYQFNQFSKHGLNAIRIFQYIKTMEGLQKKRSNDFLPVPGDHRWVKIENKNLYKWFGVHQPAKWVVCNKLKKAKLIKYETQGVGRAPLSKIICPEKNLN